MPFVPAINVADVGIVFISDGQLVEITQEYNAPDLTTAGLLTLATTVAGAFTDAVLPLLANDLQLDSVVATDVSTEFGPSVTFLPAEPTYGGVASWSLPSNCALCVTKQTAARGRSARGRFYLPGIPTEERLSVNRMTPTWLASLVSGLADFFAAMTTASAEPVIVSRKLAGNDRATGLVQIMTGYRVFDAVLDSQRRRLPGRGS